MWQGEIVEESWLSVDGSLRAQRITGMWDPEYGGVHLPGSFWRLRRESDNELLLDLKEFYDNRIEAREGGSLFAWFEIGNTKSLIRIEPALSLIRNVRRLGDSRPLEDLAAAMEEEKRLLNIDHMNYLERSFSPDGRLALECREEERGWSYEPRLIDTANRRILLDLIGTWEWRAEGRSLDEDGRCRLSLTHPNRGKQKLDIIVEAGGNRWRSDLLGGGWRGLDELQAAAEHFAAVAPAGPPAPPRTA